MTKNPDSPANRTHLTLYLPGIFNAPRADEVAADEFRALETLLVRAERHEHFAPAGHEDGLFALFSLRQDENADLPVAAVTRMSDMGVIDNDWWLRADPVHLSLERDGLVLADAKNLDVTKEEANQLVSEIMEVFTADGWVLKAPRPERWYLKPAHEPRITTTSLAKVTGRDIHPFLPAGPDSMTWHTTLNEIQILLHTTTVNAKREQNGKRPINSLWFWGGGRLPRIAPVSWAQVWSNEPVSLSLARLTGTPSENVPEGFDDWRSQADKPGEHLVVLDDIRTAGAHTGAAQWNNMMQRIEKKWMQPLLRALKSNVLSSATLMTDSGVSFTLTSRQAHRWWRRRRSLALYRRP